MQGKKHIGHTPSDHCQSFNTHFQKSKKNEEPTTGQVITNSSLVTNKNQAAIDMFIKENVIRAEIRWALKTVKSKFLLRSCESTMHFDKNNLLQISSDGPNANLIFLELIAENREIEELPPLRHCNLWAAYSPQQSKSRNQIV